MLYKQEHAFLQYREHPVSSEFYNYSPKHPEQPKMMARDGCIRFCVPHNHVALEIIRVVSGEIVMTANNQRYDMKEGDIIFLNPFDVHTLVIERADVRDEYQCINFDLSLLQNKVNTEFNEYLGDIESGKLKFQNYIPNTHPSSEALVSALIDLHRAYAKRNTHAGFMMITSELLRFMAILSESGLAYTSDEKKLTKQATFSRDVVKYVSNNYAFPLTTEDIAEALHFNKSYFCRNFKAVFEQTFVDYLNSYRISVAKNLSLKDYKTLAEIAAAVGYENYDNFAIYFKKHTGLTPKAYFKRG